MPTPVPHHSDARSALPISQGSLLDFPKDPAACMRKLQAEHGDLVALEEGDQRLVFIFGPRWNQEVLSDSTRFHSRFFAIRGSKRSAQRRLTSGLLSMNGDEHKQHRRMVMGPFQKQAIGQYHGTICQLTDELLSGWKVGQVRDMHADMTQFMLRVSSSLLFGLDDPALAYQVGAMIDEWVRMNHEMGMGAFLADRRFTENYDRLLEMAKSLEADVQTMIDRKRAQPELGTDVLSLLIRAHEQEGRVNDGELIGHIALMYGAAHLTTAHTLTWTLFLLAQHPSVMRELAAEISSQTEAAFPSLDELESLSVTERVVKESMRVLPASGYSQRICAMPLELGPFRLSRGTPVIFSQFITHHMPELFPDPHAFLPERWLSISPSPYAYLPFGAGPRMCLGAPLAMMTLKIVLPSILKRFRLSAIADSEVNGRIVSTMLSPIGELPMSVHPPDGRFAAEHVTGSVHGMVDLREMPNASQSTRRAA